jgi:hypothetical protein
MSSISTLLSEAESIRTRIDISNFQFADNTWLLRKGVMFSDCVETNVSSDHFQKIIHTLLG